MATWNVRLLPNSEIELKSLFKKGLLSKQDVKALLRWVDEMEEHGPDFIAQSSEWHDHCLFGEWKGYRASAFSHSGRVIYQVLRNDIIVEIHKVTPNHDYRK